MDSLKSSRGDTLGSTLIIVVVIILAAGLMFVFPLMVTSSQKDKIAYNQVYVALVDFTNNAATLRKIDEANMDAFIQKIDSTGNVYEVEVEVQRLDQNPSKKVTQVETTKIGENLYYTEYFTFYTNMDVTRNDVTRKDVQDIFNIKLNQGDIITVRATKTSTTIFESLRNGFLQMIGSSKVVTSDTVVVK